jgi:hypothetical protein
VPDSGVLLLLALLPLAPPLVARWYVPGYRSVAVHWLLLQVFGGAAVGMFVAYFVGIARMVLGGMSDPASLGSTLAGLRHLIVIAPLSQALLVLVVLPLRRRHLLRHAQDGMLCAASAGAGLCFTESFLLLLETTNPGLAVAQILLAIPAAIFTAGLWGYFVGLRSKHSWRGFTAAWSGGLLLKALYDYLLFDLGPGYKVAVLPLLAFMLAGIYLGLKTSVDREPPPSSSRSLALTSLGHKPTLSDVRDAMNPGGHRIMVFWTLIGVFVILGATMVALAAAVVVGQRLGVDFTQADEADLHSNSPLLLAGLAVLIAFPVAGGLIALASGTDSTLEVAVASGVAILAAAAALSVTEPLVLVFVFAVSPVAFSLACAAGWWVARRRRARVRG